MPDDDSQDRHPAFCFLEAEPAKQESKKRNNLPARERMRLVLFGAVSLRLFFQPRDMPGGELPPTVTLD
jgi:hypothetical protein